MGQKPLLLSKTYYIISSTNISKHRCCNTCDDLIKAYQAKQWSIDTILRNSTQCLRDRAEISAIVHPEEGCTISGNMKVNKVAGNFHIAHGESIVRDGRHIHQFNPFLAPKFNVSHTIHSISFGDPYPSMPKNPLDNGLNYRIILIELYYQYNYWLHYYCYYY